MMFVRRARGINSLARNCSWAVPPRLPWTGAISGDPANGARKLAEEGAPTRIDLRSGQVAMAVPAKRLRTPGPRHPLPTALPEIALYHGEALWVLAQLGFRGSAAESTFNEYIKSLRKLGAPFERGKNEAARRGLD
jgi:hypothetical protein